MRFLVTSGGTSEPIDEVRSITNKSTGTLGRFLAESLHQLCDQAEIHYVCSDTADRPTDLLGCTHIVSSVADLHNKMDELLSNYRFDVIVHAMAVSDYTIAGALPLEQLPAITGKQGERISEILSALPQEKKIDSTHDNLVLILKKTPKIIGMIRKKQPDAILVGFKLLVDVEEVKLLEAADRLLSANGCNFVFANDLINVADADSHHGLLIDKSGIFARTSSKYEAANAIAKHALSLLRKEVV